jgi:hypothetical protein
MSVLLQQILVAIAVLCCALFSAWRLASHQLRLRALAALSALPGIRTSRALARLRQRTLAQQAGACGACAQGATPDAASRNRTPGALRR